MEFEVPEEMLRRGRPLIPKFEDDENLYRRVPPGQYLNRIGGVIPLYAVPLPNASVNREVPNGQPEFVLYDTERGIKHNDFGILSVKCEDVPLQADENSSGQLGLRTSIEHDPLEKNYYHTEIRVRNMSGEKWKAGDDLDSFDQEFRIILRSKLRVIREPS